MVRAMAAPRRVRACAPSRGRLERHATALCSLGSVALCSLALGGCAGTTATASSAGSASPAPDTGGEGAWDGLSEKASGPLERAETRLAKSLAPDDVGFASPEASDGATPEALSTKPRHPTGTPHPTSAPRSSGERCLAELTAQKVRFKSLDARPGIETPVLVSGSVGAISYFAHGIELVLDCRMALSLAQISPIFAKHGVSKVRFSGAYVYRLTRHGKLSLHANGLALDVHALTVGPKVHTVEAEFARGVGCDGDIPLVNRIACELRATALFREVITPDYDADHKDHLHIAIPRLASTPSTISTDTPPAKAPRAESAHAEPSSPRPSPPVPGSLPEAIPEVRSVSNAPPPRARAPISSP